MMSNYISPFRYKKTPESLDFPGFLNHFDIVWAVDYRLLNCGALRAALRPYFLRSFIRGSLVKNPAALRVGLYSLSTWRSAREIPWRMAPACPEYPPPFTFTKTSNLSTVSVATNGWRTITFKVSRPKYSSISLLLIVIFPVPGTK